MKHSPSFLILRQTLLPQTYLCIQCMIDFNEIAYQLVISVLQCFACAVYFASQCYIIFINLKKNVTKRFVCLFACFFVPNCVMLFSIFKKKTEKELPLCFVCFCFRLASFLNVLLFFCLFTLYILITNRPYKS